MNERRDVPEAAISEVEHWRANHANVTAKYQKLQRLHRQLRRKHYALEFNYEGAGELERCWAAAVRKLVSALPGYAPPKHDHNCPSCTITEGLEMIAKHLGKPKG